MLLGTFIAYIAVAVLIVSSIITFTKPNIINEFGVFMSLIVLMTVASMVSCIEKYPYQPGQKEQVTNISNSMYQTKHGLYTYNRNHVTFKTTSAKDSYIIIKRPQKIGFGNALEYMTHKTSIKKTLYLNSHDQHKLLQY